MTSSCSRVDCLIKKSLKIVYFSVIVYWRNFIIVDTLLFQECPDQRPPIFLSKNVWVRCFYLVHLRTHFSFKSDF